MNAVELGPVPPERRTQPPFDLFLIFAGANLVRFVSLEPVQAEAILLRVDCDRAQVQFVCRAENADRDFAAVGGKQFLDRT